MSVISSTKPQAWTLSPQMTAAPHMWKGVEHFLIGDVTQRKDLGAAGGQFAVDGSPSNALTEMGRGIEFLRANSQRIYHASHVATVMTRCVLVKITSAANQLLTMTAEGPESGTRDRTIRVSNSVFEAYVFFEGSRRYATGFTVPVVGEIYHLAFTLGSGFLRLYVNGKEEASVAASVAFTGFLTPTIVYGEESVILQAVDWLRELSADEIAEHARDPFAMLRPAGF